MRKLNEKIYQIAQGTSEVSPQEAANKPVDVNQLLSESFFKESQQGVIEQGSQSEAARLLKDDHDKLYPSKKPNPTKTSPITTTLPQTKKRTVKPHRESLSKPPKSPLKKEKKSQSPLLLFGLIIIVLIIAFIFITSDH